jgi:hypothetical protein
MCSFVIASDEDPFEALKGLNLKLKDENKEDKKDETKSDSSHSKTEQDKKTEELVTKKTRPALEDAAKSDTKTTNKVEAATWLLLTGEYLFKDAKESTLWSDTITSLHKGTEQLNLLEKEIESDEEKLKELFKEENLAIRYDIARTRREALAEKEKLAREQELDRLHQLRQILLSYTELATKMSEADEYRQLGNLAKSANALNEAIKHIDQIKRIADSRKDYYLFKDEPKIEGNEEFEILKVVSPVFSQQLVVHLKTLHSATLFRLAILLQDKEIGNKLLDEAIKTAQDTLTESDKDKNIVKNPILPYIISEAFLMKAIHVTESESTSEAKHKEAAPYFKEALEKLELAASLLEEPDAKEVAALKTVIKRNYDHLTNPQSFIEEAQNALLQGNNKQALSILQTAILLHRVPTVWAVLLETAVRCNTETEELALLLKDAEKVITKNDLIGQTAIGRAVITILEPKITSDKISTEEKQTQLIQLESAGKTIAELKPIDEKDELIKGKATAVLAKLLTLQELLIDDDKQCETRGREAVRIAENSLAALDKQTDNTFEKYQQHEYKAIAYHTLGYNSVRWLPEHRKEGFIAYTAAMDELSKLPDNNNQIAFFGSPLLNAATGKFNSDKIAAEEQSLRIMLSKFIEGTFTLQFGESQQASEQFEKALNESRTVGIDQADSTAAETFEKSSGFDTGASFRETLAAYSILADIAANKKERALDNCLKLLNAEKSDIALAIPNLQSPLLAFALAKTLDEFVLATGVNLSEEKKQYIALAKQTFQRGGELSNSPKLKKQYPHIIALIQQGNDWYVNDNYFLNQLANNLQNNLEIISDGLKRHPTSKELWSQYITLQYKRLQLRKATDNDYRALLDELAKAQQEKLLNPFVYYYYEGFLREQLNQNVEALTAFIHAVQHAETPIDTIKAQAKAGELRTRLAVN